jgi:hypothetical protein
MGYPNEFCDRTKKIYFYHKKAVKLFLFIFNDGTGGSSYVYKTIFSRLNGLPIKSGGYKPTPCPVQLFNLNF